MLVLLHNTQQLYGMHNMYAKQWTTYMQSITFLQIFGKIGQPKCTQIIFYITKNDFALQQLNTTQHTVHYTLHTKH